MFEINQLGPFTSMSDQDRTSPYNIMTVLSRKLIRIKKNYYWGIISSKPNSLNQHHKNHRAKSKENH